MNNINLKKIKFPFLFLSKNYYLFVINIFFNKTFYKEEFIFFLKKMNINIVHLTKNLKKKLKFLKNFSENSSLYLLSFKDEINFVNFFEKIIKDFIYINDLLFIIINNKYLKIDFKIKKFLIIYLNKKNTFMDLILLINLKLNFINNILKNIIL